MECLMTIHCGSSQFLYPKMMSAWLALSLMLLSAAITVLSYKANQEAAQTGRLRFLLWHIRGWGEREKSPTFFKLGQALHYYRTGFFALVTILCGAYFLESIGLIN
jgi:hypothetical protein